MFGWSRRLCIRLVDTAETLLRWCAAMGGPRAWVNDTARYFKTRALQSVADSLGTSHCFAVATSVWTIGTVECILHQLLIVRTSKALLNKGCVPLEDWMLVEPVAPSGVPLPGHL